MNESRLRQAYDQLQRRRAHENDSPLVSLENVRRLAESPSINTTQIALLDQVLAHPVTRAEFYFLRDVVRGQPLGRHWGMRVWTAMAALFVIGLGLSVIMRGPANRGAEPMRGPSGVMVLAPAANAIMDSGTRFTWHSVNQASTYTLELLDADGAVVWRNTSPDTSVVLPANIALQGGARYTWLVRASLLDGTAVRSTSRAVRARP